MTRRTDLLSSMIKILRFDEPNLDIFDDILYERLEDTKMVMRSHKPRIDNNLTKRKRQAMVGKRLQRKLKLEQHTPY